jgi:hypothetical protein
MKELLTNFWVVGIVGGILSGLSVAWITRIIFSKKDNKEYLRKVLQANKDVIFSVRATISDGDIPSREIISALISSNSIKYGIEVTNMFTIEQICDDLIKEVMDSSFISSKIKNEYCEKLITLKNQKVTDLKGIPEEDDFQNKNVRSALEYRQQLITNMAMILGIMAALMSFGFTVFLSLDNEAIPRTFDNGSTYIIPIIVAFAAIIGAFVVKILNLFKRMQIIKEVRETQGY